MSVVTLPEACHEDAQSGIASDMPLLDPSVAQLMKEAFWAQLLLEESDLKSFEGSQTLGAFPLRHKMHAPSELSPQ